MVWEINCVGLIVVSWLEQKNGTMSQWKNDFEKLTNSIKCSYFWLVAKPDVKLAGYGEVLRKPF